MRTTVIGWCMTVMDQRWCVRFCLCLCFVCYTTFVQIKSYQEPSLSWAHCLPWSLQTGEMKSVFKMMLFPNLTTVYWHTLSLGFLQPCLEIGLEPHNLVRNGFLWRERRRGSWTGSGGFGCCVSGLILLSGQHSEGLGLPYMMSMFEKRAQRERSGPLGGKGSVIVEGWEAEKGDSWWLMWRCDILSFPQMVSLSDVGVGKSHG